MKKFIVFFVIIIAPMFAWAEEIIEKAREKKRRAA
jgi:hypothetical protein